MRISSLQTKTNSRRGSPSAKSITFVLALAACGFVLLTYERGGVGTAASIVFTPIASVRTRFMESSERLLLYLRTRRAVIGEISWLKTQLQERETDAFARRRLEAENESLREALVLVEESRVLARVLARPNQTPYDTLLIDRGAADGVVQGASVFIRKDIAVGVVAKTYPHSSLVRLVSAPGTKATVYIFGPNIFTQAEGMGGGVLRVSVPQGIPLAVGNVVVLPAAGVGAYGEVVSVEAAESSPQQYGYITSPVPLASVRFVDVAQEAAPTLSYKEALEVITMASSTLFGVPVPDGALVSTTTAASASVAEE